MKENAKLYKAHSNRKSYQVSKRLGSGDKHKEDEKMDDSNVVKRKKGVDGKVIEVPKGLQTPVKLKP